MPHCCPWEDGQCSLGSGSRGRTHPPSVPGFSCQCFDSTRVAGNLELACSEGHCDWNGWAVPHTCPSVPEAPWQAEGWTREAHSAALVPRGSQWWCAAPSSLCPPHVEAGLSGLRPVPFSTQGHVAFTSAPGATHMVSRSPKPL